MNPEKLIEILDETWPLIDEEQDWRELGDSIDDSLLIACAVVLSSPYARLSPQVLMQAAWEVLTTGFAEAAAPIPTDRPLPAPERAA